MRKTKEKKDDQKVRKVRKAFERLIEQVIYDWVVENFGKSEAESPSWNPNALAKAVATGILNGHKAENKIRYEDRGVAMGMCVHYATQRKIEYSQGGWFRDNTEEFFDALDALGCSCMHVDYSDLYEVEKDEVRKLLTRLQKRDPGDYKVGGLRINDIVSVLEEALEHGEPDSAYIHFYTF